MAFQNNELYRQKSKVANLFAAIEEGAAEELADLSIKSDIKWLKQDEEEWLERRSAPGEYAGVSTGYDGVDNILGSFVPGELFTIGGDTGHGKSLFAFNIAQNAYAKHEKPVIVVSLELTEDQTRERFYELSGPDRDYAGILVQSFSEVSYKDIDVIMQKAKDEGACLVVIDHLHFFDESLGDNQAAALARIVKHFKGCATRLELPVVLLSHVTLRKAANGETIKPDLADLRGSRAISQLSDMVGFVYRDTDNPTEVEFYLRKQRSRMLNKESTYLTQKGWKLEEQKLWAPSKQNSQPSGESSQANLV